MNVAPTRELVDRNRVVTLKADKTGDAPEVDQLLVELGNAGRAIPFYAIYPAHGGDPILLDGIVTRGQIRRALQEAGPSRSGTSELVGTSADDVDDVGDTGSPAVPSAALTPTRVGR